MFEEPRYIPFNRPPAVRGGRWSCTRRLWVAGRVARPLRAKAAMRDKYDSASYARNFTLYSLELLKQQISKLMAY